MYGGGGWFILLSWFNAEGLNGKDSGGSLGPGGGYCGWTIMLLGLG